MLYDRKIKYLDYYEGGSKVNGSGFAKLEVRENTLRIELTIRGLHPTDSFERDIVLQGAEKEETLGQIRIQNGFGQFRYSCDADQGIGGTGISYGDLRGIRISIGGTREILCQWDNASGKRRITPPEEDAQKSKSVLQETQESGSVLQETKREPIVESYTDNKTDSEVPVYTENEQTHKPKQEKTEEADEKRKEVVKEAVKEEYKSIEDRDRKEESIEDKDRKEDNIEDIDWKRQGDENREDENRQNDNRQDDNRQDDNRQDGNRQDENRQDENRQDDNRQDENRQDRNRQDDNRQGENREDQEDKNIVQPKPTEMQAQGAAMLLEAISPQLPEEPFQTGLQSGGQSEDLTKDQTKDLTKNKPDLHENNRAEQPDVRKAPVKLMEDKWQQLSAIYPHIQPFHDERDYLSLTPSDFVLFPDRFYRAVNNSFLLHGYYNYHHLILARIERRGEIIYYIGVPGNYFEREKQVAIMFGFESFECETEPAKTGDFGYYMMRTEL